MLIFENLRLFLQCCFALKICSFKNIYIQNVCSGATTILPLSGDHLTLNKNYLSSYFQKRKFHDQQDNTGQTVSLNPEQDTQCTYSKDMTDRSRIGQTFSYHTGQNRQCAYTQDRTSSPTTHSIGVVLRIECWDLGGHNCTRLGGQLSLCHLCGR